MQEQEQLNPDISNKLLVYQIEHTLNITYILKTNTTTLDASDTGTGKTYTAIAACAQMNLIPIIICPKSVLSSWKRVCKIFNVQPLMIVNYESIRIGKYYVNGKRKKCPYIEIESNKGKPVKYKWHLQDKEKTIFIFDEVHKCSNLDTQNGKLLYYSKNEETFMLILSATVADHPEKFKLFFYILNFIDPKNVKEKNLTYDQYMVIMQKWIFRDIKPMLRIHQMLYPTRSTRMKIDTLGDLFPETQIIAQPYTMEKTRQDQIEKEYNNIAKEMDSLREKGKKDRGSILTKILRSHQKIELLKIPTFVELTNDFIENGFSVVIFVNFTQTLETLSDMLYTDCLIYGKQTGEQRDRNIARFQENKSRVIICNLMSGSVGLSLHDLYGGFPRASLISPTWSSTNLIQALGRVHRAGAKSKSLQRIIYTANTIEEKIAEKLQQKLRDLSTLNDGDVDLTNITFEKERINA
ncbi:DEAD/SNF2-like helicase [Catovirus CTV1]|uniref:DEAD/SNF2-like helicase n=1 Tax=Catovirus CTV1 TaxID=1977631 RepID=A0A1V0SAW7_9VIRU|nr:DEAD/SNF2-like helicase [Catovirus CTV1]